MAGRLASIKAESNDAAGTQYYCINGATTFYTLDVGWSAVPDAATLLSAQSVTNFEKRSLVLSPGDTIYVYNSGNVNTSFTLMGIEV